MSRTLDERARDSSEALRSAAALRSTAPPSHRARTALRVTVTAAVLVVALSVGAVIALRNPSSTSAGSSGAEPVAMYRASAVLIDNSQAKSNRDNVQQDALLLTIGVVPRRVAVELHFGGDPARLAAQVLVTANTKAGTITITSTQPTAAKAIAVVNAFGEQLVGYLDNVAKSGFNVQAIDALQHQTTLQRLLAPVDRQISALQAQGLPVPSPLDVQRRSLAAALSTATKKYQTILRGGIDTRRYRLVESTNAALLYPPHDGTSNPAPRTTLIVVGVLALLLIGCALGLRRRRSSPVP